MDINKILYNCIFNEDCLVTMDRLPDNCLDLVVTSPPYDNLRDYKGYVFDYSKVIHKLYRIIKPGGVVVWVVGDATVNGSETGTSFKHALCFKDNGFNIHDTMIWQKTNAIPKIKTKRYYDVFEYMFIFSKGQPKTFNPIQQDCKNGGKTITTSLKQISKDKIRKVKTYTSNLTRNKDNIWKYAVGKNETSHPAVFPYDLVHDHIISWSNENDLVYDPFAGSGTTLLACKNLNRLFIGSEISSEYTDIIINRVECHVNNIFLGSSMVEQSAVNR